MIVARHRLRLIGSAVCAVVAAAGSLAPFVAVYAVTVALFSDDGDPGRIPAIAGWTAVAIVLRAVAQGVSTHLGHVAAYRVLADVRRTLARRLQVIPLARVRQRSTGEMKKVLHDDVEQLEEALAHGVPDGAAAAAVPLVTTALLLALDWRLALVALGSLVLLVAVSAVGMRLAMRSNEAQAKHATVLQGAIMGYLQGIEVIRSFVRADRTAARASRAVLEAERLEIASTSGAGRWVVAVMSVATGCTVALLLPVAGPLFLDGDISFATMALFLLLALGYLTPVIGLVGTLATIMVRVQLAAGSVSELLEAPSLPTPTEPRVPERFDVHVEGVSFAYEPDHPVLADVSLVVPEGATTALVGHTGSGKSTLASLLARHADVDAGAVRIGGVDVRDIATDVLARTVAFVQQSEHIFAASLLENIRIARPDATDAEVVAAATDAQLAPVADKLPDGWGTELPSGGGTLSGGERQRIAIARALLKDARVLVLDEITASLDAATERATLAAIARASRGRTVIAIAHRLSTIQDAAEIAYLDGGRIVDRAPHAELLARCEPYADLWHAYTHAAGWRLAGTAKAAPEVAPIDDVEAAEAVAADVDPVETDVDPIGTDVDPAKADDVGARERAAARLARPGIARLGFARQWRALYGASWPRLLRHGVVRLVAEGLVRGVPLIAVFVVVTAATGNPVIGSGLDTTMVAVVTALLVGGLAARLLASVWANGLVWRLSAAAKADLQLSLLSRMRRVPLGFFRRTDSGRLSTLIGNDVPMLDFQNVPQQIVGSLVQPICSVVLLCIVDWRLACAALAGFPVFWALTVWSDRVYRRVFADLHVARRSTTSVLLDQVRGTAVLRGNPGSGMERRADSAIDDLARASTSMSVGAAPATALGAIAVELGLVLLILLGAALSAAGAVDAVTLLAFLFLSLAIYQPIQELMSLTGYRRSQQQVAAAIADVWEEPVLREPDRPTRPADASVAFEGVTFRYDGADTPALDDVTFDVPSGRVTALVGRSGAGKSTAAHLIARLWDPDAGAVRIGGVALSDLGSDGVVAQVAVVQQHVYLFDDTVRENLRIARPGATDEELWEALRVAQCDDVVRELPHGLGTALNDGGTDLSGGQRQRLAIARALLKDAPILVLDEAVASVDPGTEDRIQQAIASLAAARTVIVIAHRITTVQAADRIVVLDDGRVAGVGTHDELVAVCPEYAALAQEQGAA
ncbi:Lipid A export ATP-binding/permease protein MsbA [Actinomycetales bacterium JB111]|nr:Lipid A export ATP-binding/permease protein MsbA [Actinomycetales bacterium JB111]